MGLFRTLHSSRLNGPLCCNCQVSDLACRSLPGSPATKSSSWLSVESPGSPQAEGEAWPAPTTVSERPGLLDSSGQVLQPH